MKNRDLRISDSSRKEMSYFAPVFETSNDLASMFRQAQEVARRYNLSHTITIRSGKLHASAVLHLLYQTVISSFLRDSDTDFFNRMAVLSEKNQDCTKVLEFYNKTFPSELKEGRFEFREEEVRAFFVHQVLQANPALLAATQNLLNQKGIKFPEGTQAFTALMGGYLKGTTINESSEEDLFSFLTHPARLYPDSLFAQIQYIIENWEPFLPEELRNLLLRSLDYIKEEEKPSFNGKPGPVKVPDFTANLSEAELFTPDRNWMPNVVMIAKSTLVWLDQLSRKYEKDIHTLDAIPDEELDILKSRGFTALWLIGLWERSPASRKIKNWCGNTDADSSAYSLKSYSIASAIGGWGALENLKARCSERGIRLASDMVPNHTGLDSDWVINHTDYFIRQSWPPFPSYTYTGGNLSDNPDIEIRIEDHYYNRTDAAVTFMKHDRRTGETTYIFHGNDGTTMPWNDTAQLDFLNPQTREAVIQQIIQVAKNFPIIRFDAAMTLAKKHIQRLWYPRPGSGGDVAGRAANGLTDEEFNKKIPNEFWREVVDRLATELPDTLLLAEAFWMMESYFVRTLGMHRVYNSAFMHMLKNQDNAKYRESIKNTIAFDPEILKRYVNFMNNPDEDTAIAQFGNGDKYFGVCTLLATMPGLPMFGHGQIEGYKEKYGMEYHRAYWDETPDENLQREHEKRIFPLLKLRHLFSGSQYFQLFDLTENNQVRESVFAYTNGDESRMTLVLYNNQYENVHGFITESAPKMVRKEDGSRCMETLSLAQSLRLTIGGRRFVIYKNFNDGLTYLLPSMKLFEDGLEISLNGYQTKIFINIHEIEDIDGVYAGLWERLGGRGVEDLTKEIRAMYLEPFFEAVESVKSQKFNKDLKALLNGKATASNKRNILQTLGECYTYADELSVLFSKIDLNVHIMKPASMLELINRIDKLSKTKVFGCANGILDEDLCTMVTSMLLILPFLSTQSSLSDALKVAQNLMLERFFNTSNLLPCQGAILTCNSPMNLEDAAFLTLIGANAYNGVTWYRTEAFQESLYLSILSRALHSEGPIDEEAIQRELNFWLRRNFNSSYQLEKLKLKDGEEGPNL